MKKLIVIATAITILIIISCACVMTAYAEADTVTISAVVIDFDYNKDTVDCLDEQGNIWTFYEIEDWIVGDKVVLTIWAPTNEILDVAYTGWMEIFDFCHYVVEVCG